MGKTWNKMIKSLRKHAWIQVVVVVVWSILFWITVLAGNAALAFILTALMIVLSSLMCSDQTFTWNYYLQFLGRVLLFFLICGCLGGILLGFEQFIVTI